MSTEIAKGNHSWKEAIHSWLHPKILALFFLGFAAGLPLLLIFSTLSVWLREAGVERATVTFFSWAALAYSFKFIWAPLVDLIPLPFLTRKLGRRRGWLLLAQMGIITAICCMAAIDPATHMNRLEIMALAAVLLGFSSATQDIVIDAYRIECSEKYLQALLSSTYVAGYRVGMLVSGAGSLFLASYLGTSPDAYSYPAWQQTYLAMAVIMFSGIITTLTVDEPAIANQKKLYQHSPIQYLQLLAMFCCAAGCFGGIFFYSKGLLIAGKALISTWTAIPPELALLVLEPVRFLVAASSALALIVVSIRFGLVNKDMVKETYVYPVADFFRRYGGKSAVLILLLVGFYRVTDIVLGVVANVFYVDLGFSKNVIAGITKSFGLGMTLLGGFLGGTLTVRFGIMRILFAGALCSSLGSLLFMVLAKTGNSLPLLTFAIGVDNLCAGFAATAFVAFLSSLTNISFTAVQYAIFSSVMTLFPKLIGGYSGTTVTALGYDTFFLITALMGIPVLFLIWLNRKAMMQNEE